MDRISAFYEATGECSAHKSGVLHFPSAEEEIHCDRENVIVAVQRGHRSGFAYRVQLVEDDGGLCYAEEDLVKVVPLKK